MCDVSIVSVIREMWTDIILIVCVVTNCHLSSYGVTSYGVTSYGVTTYGVTTYGSGLRKDVGNRHLGFGSSEIS